MELNERFSRLKTKIAEREISSPVKGEVFGLSFFNSGTVVRPAEKIMGIVPFGSTFVIEAKVSPIDIDEVYVGQTVRVILPQSKDQSRSTYLQNRQCVGRCIYR